MPVPAISHTTMPHMARTSKHKDNLPSSILSAWRTNNRVTIDLIECLPPALWDTPIPNVSRKTVRTIAAHLHNARCSWLKTLGSEHGIAVPEQVSRTGVTPRQLVAALKRSSAGMEKLLQLGLDHEGQVPPSKDTSGAIWP